jgi:hypothetical protein
VSLFSRRKRKSAHPQKVIGHLLTVGIQAAIEGTEESAEEAAAHMAKDLTQLDAETLAKVAGILLIDRADAEAGKVREATKRLMDALYEGAQEAAQEDCENLPAPVPTGEPGLPGEPGVDGVPGPDGVEPAKDWQEDRT